MDGISMWVNLYNLLVQFSREWFFTKIVNTIGSYQFMDEWTKENVANISNEFIV